jgi:hypothetical protein
MRVRIALALALVAIATGLVIDMSGAAPRLAGGNDTHWPAPDFSDAVPGGGSVCEAGTALPADAARMVMTIGSYGRPLPRISVTFTPTGSTRTLRLGGLAAGGVQGAEVSVPLRHPHGPSAAGTLCLRVGGHHPLVFGDEAGVSGSTIDGTPVPGTVVSSTTARGASRGGACWERSTRASASENGGSSETGRCPSWHSPCWRSSPVSFVC